MKNLIILLFLFSISCCTKEYSSDNSVIITVTGKQYQSSINGSPGNFWAISLKLSKPLETAIRVVYTFDDSKGFKGMTISQSIGAGERENIFYTQYPAIGNMQNVYLVRVEGSSLTFKLTQ